MQKKTIVLALGATLAAPGVMAQAIELYGKAYPELVSIRSSGASATGTFVSTIAGTPSGTNAIVSRNEMQSGNSRFGIRGKEKLFGDVTGIYQFETAFGVDTPTAFAARDSFVGVETGFGTIKLGRMDTIYKSFGDQLSFLGISSGNFVSTSNIMRSTGFGTNGASSFHLRRQNAIHYDSPEFGGFGFGAQYSPGEAKTATRNPEVLSLGVKYDNGPFYFAISHEIHDDLFGGSNNAKAAQSNVADLLVNSKDKATQFTGKYKFGDHTFEMDLVKKKYNENARVNGRFLSYENDAIGFLTESRWNSVFRTSFHYLKAYQGKCALLNAGCQTNGLAGSQISIGGQYVFSRRTNLFTLYSVLNNGAGARYNNSDLQTPNVGEDIKQFAVGISHTF